MYKTQWAKQLVIKHEFKTLNVLKQIVFSLFQTNKTVYDPSGLCVLFLVYC